jgi:hypothetical protein
MITFSLHNCILEQGRWYQYQPRNQTFITALHNWSTEERYGVATGIIFTAKIYATAKSLLVVEPNIMKGI